MAIEPPIDGVLEAFIVLLPAFFANAFPVVVKGEKPIDLGLKFIDGRRLLGDGKTWEGLAGGLSAGCIVGSLTSLALKEEAAVFLALVASAGALLGDMAGSFVKRRLGMSRGAAAPPLDQLDFYVGAVAALTLAGYGLTATMFLLYAAITVVLHLAANAVAYSLGLKSHPW